MLKFCADVGYRQGDAVDFAVDGEAKRGTVIRDEDADGVEIAAEDGKVYRVKADSVKGIIVRESPSSAASSPAVSGDSEPEPVGVGKFGNIYDQFKGKVKEAVSFLFKKRGGEAKDVFYREEIGNIGLIWGDDKQGLRHIIQKHIVAHSDFDSVGEMYSTIQDVIENGDITIQKGGSYRIEKDGKRAIIAKNENGDFVLTAYAANRSIEEKKRSDADATLFDQRVTDEMNGTLVSSDIATGGEVSENNSDMQEGDGDKVSEVANDTKESQSTPSPMQAIPVDAKGNPLYEQARVEDTINDLYNDPDLDEEEADAFVQAKIDGATKRIAQLEKKKPKMGEDKEGYKAQRAKWREQLEAEQASLAYWQGVQAAVSEMRRKERARQQMESDIAQRERELQERAEQARRAEERGRNRGDYRKAMSRWDDAPGSFHEYVAQALLAGDHKMRWNDNGSTRGLGRHTTGRRGVNRRGEVVTARNDEARTMSWLIDDRTGLSPEALADRLWNDYTGSYGEEMQEGNPLDVLLDVLTSMPTPQAMWDYVKGGHDARKEAERGANEEQYSEEEMEAFERDAMYREKYGMSEDEYWAREAELEEQGELAEDKAGYEAERNDTISDARALVTEAVVNSLEASGIEVVEASDAMAEAVMGMGDSTHEIELQAVNDKFNAELQQQIDGTLPKGHVYSLGYPSAILRSAGLPNLPIELASSRLSDKSMQENHPFELSEIEGLVNAIQNPLAVFRSATHIGSYVVLTEIEHKGKNFVVAIEANRKQGRLEVNSVRSIHYRSSNTHIANWIKDDLMEYADKKRMSEWISKQRYNSADVRNLFRHVAKVVQNFENPKIEAQIVYHGSGAKFEAFDHSHIGEGEGAQAYGWGTYVTEVEGIGKQYANTMRDKAITDKHRENAIINNLARQVLASNNGNKAETLEYLRGLLNESWSDKKRVRAQIKIIETGKFLPETKVKAQLYTVEIPEDNGSNYLYYDKVMANNVIADVKRRLYDILSQGQYKGAERELREEIDIVFTPGMEGDALYNNISAYLGGDKQASQFFNEMGFVGIKYPAQYTTGGRADGKSNYVIFNEADVKITNRVEFLKTPQGVVYGWTDGKKVYLTKEGMNPETPIHEYTHLWARAMMQGNAEGWQSVKDLLRGTPVWDEVMSDANYADIHGDEDAVASECLARLSGRENAKRMEAEARKMIDEANGIMAKAEAVTLIERMKRALREFWDWVGTNLFDIKSFGSIDEVTDRVLWDLVENTELGRLESGKVEFMGSRVEKRMAEIASHFDGRTLDGNDKAIVNAFANGTKNEVIAVNGKRITLKQGNENNAGVKHSLMRHYGTPSGNYLSEELLLIPEVIGQGERMQNGKKVSYKKEVNGTVYVVTTEIRSGVEEFTNFYTNRKPISKSLLNTDEQHGTTSQSVSTDKGTTILPNANDLGEKIAAAEAEVNTNPTDKQKEAGNYKKGHVKVGAFNITIEQPKGSVRRGVDADGKKWETTMRNTYGYIRGTEGVDGDHIDVFLSDDIDGWNGRQVYVVDQRNADGSFDEHKVMLGFNDINDAETAYMSNYNEGWQGLGAITGVAIEDFEKWIASSHRKTKAFAEYKSVKTTEGQSAGEDGLLFRDGERIEDVNERFNAELQQQIDGTLPKGHIYQLGMPSDVLLSTGIANAPIQLNSQRLLDKSSNFGHDYELSEIKDLVKAINNPIAIFTYGDKSKAQNIVVEIQHEGKNFIVGLSIRPSVGGQVLDINSIRNVFPKDNAEWLNWIAQGKALFLNKEKIQTLIAQQRTNLADVKYLDLDSIANIIENFENPTIGDEISMRAGLGSYSDAEISFANDPIAKVMGRSQRTKSQQAKFAERERKAMRNRVKELTELLHLDNVEVVRREELVGSSGRKSRAKGWFDTNTGKVVINLSNHTSVADVERTLLHEAVAHYGLRELFGKQFDTFLDNVYRHAEADVRAQIVELAKSRGWDFRTATEEYLAGLAESSNFEYLERQTGFWERIKRLFLDMLESIGWNYKGPELSDNELRYLLWRSYENLANPGRHRSILGIAEDIAMRYEFGVGNYNAEEAPVSQVAESGADSTADEAVATYKAQFDKGMDFDVVVYNKAVDAYRSAVENGETPKVRLGK